MRKKWDNTFIDSLKTMSGVQFKWEKNETEDSLKTMSGVHSKRGKNKTGDSLKTTCAGCTIMIICRTTELAAFDDKSLLWLNKLGYRKGLAWLKQHGAVEYNLWTWRQSNFISHILVNKMLGYNIVGATSLTSEGWKIKWSQLLSLHSFQYPLTWFLGGSPRDVVYLASVWSPCVWKAHKNLHLEGIRHTGSQCQVKKAELGEIGRG